ncbi:MAG: hypothetical protein WA958_04090 [Tunicatimonas sp.]
METFIILSAIVALGFLGKVGLIAYEAMQMDFDFGNHQPKNESQSNREVVTQQPPVFSAPAEEVWAGRLAPSAQ